MTGVKRDPILGLPVPTRRIEWHRLINSHQWSLGFRVGLMLYDGPVLELIAEIANGWYQLRIRLWYSEKMLQRSWDRWAAEKLAGEHPGINVSLLP